MKAIPHVVKDVLNLTFPDKYDFRAIKQIEIGVHDLYLYLESQRKKFRKLFAETKETPKMKKARKRALNKMAKYRVSISVEEQHKNKGFKSALDTFIRNDPSPKEGTLISVVAIAAYLVSMEETTNITNNRGREVKYQKIRRKARKELTILQKNLKKYFS